MTSFDKSALDRTIDGLPQRFAGPGGVVAVVKDGVPILRHAWGFANLETRQPFSNSTLMPICSISKQFTCATMLSVTPDPAGLDQLTSDLLPRLALLQLVDHVLGNEIALVDVDLVDTELADVRNVRVERGSESGAAGCAQCGEQRERQRADARRRSGRSGRRRMCDSHNRLL